MTHWVVTTITGDGNHFVHSGIGPGMSSARRAAAEAVLGARHDAGEAAIVVVAQVAGACTSLVINAEDPPLTRQNVINALTVLASPADLARRPRSN